MSADRRRIVIHEPREAEIVVGGLGRVVLCGTGHIAEREVASCLRRPNVVNYRAFANTVVAGSLRQPVAPVAIDTLTSAERHRLLVSFVRLRGDEPAWRKLYGSHLSPDERFFAVTLWRRERARANLRSRLIAAREHAHARPVSVSASQVRFRQMAPLHMPHMTALNSLAKGLVPANTHQALLRSASLSANAMRASILGTVTLPDTKKFAFLVRPPGVHAALSGVVAQQLKHAGNANGASAALRAAVLPSFDRSVLSDALGVTRIAQQLASALQRPLFDARTMALVQAQGAQSALWLSRLPEFSTSTRFQEFFQSLRETHAEMEFLRTWESDPLWFLLSALAVRESRRFIGLTRDEVEQALLIALADVVGDGEFIPVLREVLHDAPHLTENQRDWLDHALEHAQAGEWRQAVPPLLGGLEGALHSAAVARSLIVVRRGKFMAAETLVKRMAIDDDYTLFVVRRVFGGDGNAFRHGRADTGERDHVLLGIVALVGWVDYFMELNAMRALATGLAERLGEAIDRVRGEAPLLLAPR